MIIGFFGHTRSGKTEAAKACKELFDGKIKSFADPVRELALNLYVNPGRAELRKVGESLRSVLGENIWLGKMAKEIQGAQNAGEIIWIDDVRYLNEIIFIQKSGGFVVGLNSDYITLFERQKKKQYHDDNLTQEQFIESLSTVPSERFISIALADEKLGLLDAVIINSDNILDVFKSDVVRAVTYLLIKGEEVVEEIEKHDVGIN